MKKRFACLALASALLALGACSAAGAEVTVWRAVPSYYLESGAAIESETVRADAGPSEIDAAVAAFNSDTNDAELERPLPDGVDITGWELDGTELKLSVSAEYASVTGYRRSIADACMVLTFCAIEGVERVSIYSEGTMLTAAMSAADIVLTDVTGAG